MSAISSQEIISIVKNKIENFDMHAEQERETGSVIRVGDGIATVYGIEHTTYGEIAISENGVKGVVQGIRKNEIGRTFFGKDTGVGQGTRIVYTRKRAGVPVGSGFLGRVVNALGEPTDGLGPIEEEDYLPVREEASGIVGREPAGVPMKAGILATDPTSPISRGQRELIIGDRQTGRTSIATDTILNQKDKGVVCIYVAIGRKTSIVAKLIPTLKKNDIMDYIIAMSSMVNETAPLQYIAPYIGTAMVEYFVHQGEDVLIVYDDLPKHAVAHRIPFLPLERSPGRETYPGDVFYPYSRLLERFSRPCGERGGGSIAALLIIETQAGNVSAYIPISVISITDGQTFLESDLFSPDMRPTVNVGLSISRVDDAARIKAMKKASESIRIGPAQYREMEVFTQFSSNLDEATKGQLAYNKRFIELSKQPPGRPLSLHEQITALCAATYEAMFLVETSDTKESQMNALAWFDEKRPEIRGEVDRTKIPNDDLIKRIVGTTNKYKTNQYKASIRPGRRSQYGRYKRNPQPCGKYPGYPEDHRCHVPGPLHQAQGE